MKTLTLIVIIIFMQLISLQSQTVVADFTADETEACNSISVTFINNSYPETGLVYHWDFGNGYTSNLKEPTVAYTLPGMYDVKLIVSNGLQMDTLIKKDYVIVHSSPKVNINVVGGEEGCAPYTTNFVDQSIPGDGNINSWNWDFGDGTISKNKNVSHTFLYESDFAVSLVIKDDNNCQGVQTYNNFISVYKPKASFIGDPINSCIQPMQTNFYNNSSGYGNLTYIWDFGDGTNDIIKNPIHSYIDGTYSVKLIVEDAKHCKDTLIKEDYINLLGVYSIFSVNKDTTCVNEEISFTNKSINAISYLWDFGDGTYSNNKSPVHSYSQPGNYLVRLTANHKFGCSDIYDVVINVEGINADFSYSDNFSCEVPAIIHYTNNSNNAVGFDWSFSNGQVSNDENPTNTYIEEGVYSTTLKVTSKHGCIATKTIDTCITVIIPKAYFTPNIWVDESEIKGCVPLTVNFKNKSKYNNKFDNIAMYLWSFGNYGHSNEENPTFVFGNIGKFNINFQFITSRGCVSIPYNSVASAGTAQHTDFYKNIPDTICASQEVQFFDATSDTSLVNEWLWLFGDTKYSNKRNPKHTYIDTGYMDVTLQSYYNGCPSIEVKEDFIYIKGPIVKIDYNVECENPFEAIFNSNAIDANKVFWDFGDETQIDSFNFNTSHIYSNNQVYNVVINAINEDNNCSFTSYKEVFIKDINANFVADTLKGCENLIVNINSTQTQDEYFFKSKYGYGKFLWDFGDGEHLVTDSTEHYHEYKNKGVFPLKLLVKDFRGCKDSSVVNIHIYKPEVDLNTKDQNGCMPLEVTFNNLTNSDTIITSWEWNFGDGTISDNENPIHTYNEFGTFNVSLKAVDALGCKGGVLKNRFIKVLKPIPDFITNDNQICYKDTVEFSPIDTTNIAQYQWDFGDGNYSSEISPKHIYDNVGYFPVTLTLIDNKGCDSSLTINDYIYIQDYPKPKFGSNNKSSECYPFQVNFLDSTFNDDVEDWLWDFGDGETSSHLKNPIHIYTAPGIYDVMLNLKTSNNCKSEILKNKYISVKGPYAEIIAPDTICRNDNVLLVATNKKDIYDLQWILGDGNTLSEDSVLHRYTSYGYVFPVLFLKSDSLGTCDVFVKDSVFIPYLNSQIINEGDTSGCMPFTVNLKNDSENANTWKWSFDDGDTSSIANIYHTYLSPGNYNVRLVISNNFGCSDTSKTNIEVFALPQIITNPDTVICLGEEVELRASGAESFEWNPKNYIINEDTIKALSQPDSTIKYIVTGIDDKGCINNGSQTIFVQQKPKVNFSDTTIIIGESVILDAFSPDISNYIWFPDYNSNCNNCPTNIVTPLESTLYEVTVVDTSACFEVTYDVYIDILKKYTIDVPTAFTPNGDGINDVIFVRGWGVEDLIFFRIFNRYGEIVFETSDKNIGWDGTYKGKMQSSETYTYVVCAKNYNNEILTKKGTIKLLK